MSYTKLTDFAAKDALLSGNPSKLVRGSELGAEFDAIVVADALNLKTTYISDATAKTTPVDADLTPIADSAASNVIKKVTWANIKATLKTYFDTLYQAAGSYATAGANSNITSLTALTAGGLPDNSVLTADIANANVTPAKLSQPFTAGTAVNTTSGTALDVTGIPSWVKRITVMLNGVSTNGVSGILVQLGSGSIETTGYLCTLGSVALAAGVTAGTMATTGALVGSRQVVSDTHYGSIVFSLIQGNVWTCQGVTVRNSASIQAVEYMTVLKTLSGALDRLRLTTVGGADTFDLGSFNIHYE